MNEMMIISAPQGGKYLPPPSPVGYQFLAVASNAMSPDMAGNKASTNRSGVNKDTVDGHDVMFNAQGGYIQYNYGLNLSAIRRGARIDTMVYLDPSVDYYPSGYYPTMIGFAGIDTLDYWSFGVKFLNGVTVLCFYVWDGSSPVQLNSTVPINKGWHLLSYEMKADGVHLYVDEKEVLFRAVSNTEFQTWSNAQGGVSAAPLTLFRAAGQLLRTRTAWTSIK